MTLYGMLLATATLGIAVILGLGFSNSGQGGEPYWPVVGVGVGLLLGKLVVLGALAGYRKTEFAEGDAICRPCRRGEHCGELGPDGCGCACPCPDTASESLLLCVICRRPRNACGHDFCLRCGVAYRGGRCSVTCDNY